jgi:ABC-type amino acid transport substrate-binding protein
MKTMHTDLFLPLVSKQGIAVIKLANLLLTHQKGDRLQPVQFYAEKYKTGVGTMQAAISYLQEIGAVALDSRGHLGTYIRDINYPVIWSLIGQNHIVGGMPLPYSRRLEGLATGLHEAFDQAGVALNLVYTRGALNRLQALAKGKFDFVILSRFAFNNATDYGLSIEEVMSIGTGSYVGQHIILLSNHDKDYIEDGMRVGIDPSSIDQSLLAKEACRGIKVKYVQINYMNLMTAMQNGQIDATIWNQDDFYASAHTFRAIPLVLKDQFTKGQENTEAIIAMEKSNRLLLQTLRSILNQELIRDIQTKVMNKELMPVY